MKLYRAFATVGGLTMVSRVAGFVRDVMIAAVLGTGVVAEAFFAALRFPNLFRRLFAEGAFNAAFVPMFARRLEAEGAESARRFAEEAMAGLALVLTVLSAVAMIAMPWFTLANAPGFSADPAKFDLTVALTRITFPYLACMSLVALLSGVLNSMKRFMAAAAAPILFNAVLIAALLVARWLELGAAPATGHLLAWGVAFAGVGQLLLVWIAAKRAGIALWPRRPRLSPAIRELLRLGVPGLIAGGVTQINIQIGGMIASFSAGAVSYLYYADRLYQLPLGVVGVAVGVVLLPDIATRLAPNDDRGVADSQNRSLEFALLLTLPAAIGLALAAEPLIRLLYERGAFTPKDTSATAWALAAYAWGLPAFVLQKVLQPAYFARSDTRTPMRFAIINLLANVALSLLLFWGFSELGLMPHVGLALATTLSGWLNTALLWLTLARRGHFSLDSRARQVLPRLAVTCAAMAAVVVAARAGLEPWLGPSAPSVPRALAVAGIVLAGMISFAAVAQLLGAVRWQAIAGALRRGR